MELTNMTDHEFEILKAQIAKEEQRREREAIKPKDMASIDLGEIVEAAKSAVEEELMGSEVETQYLYEAVLQAVYGPEIFDRIRDYREERL